eukprot:213413_1
MSDLEILLYNKVELDDGAQGVVHYIGNIMGKKGTFYGIDITKGDSKNDGSFNNIKYFKTKNGRFCTANKIINSKTTLHSKYPFKIGDIVMCSKTNCKGTVKYIGIPSWITSSKVYYGLDLKKKRGNCDGSYYGIQYFRAKNVQTGIYVPATMVKPAPPRKNTIDTGDEIKENKAATNSKHTLLDKKLDPKSIGNDSIIGKMEMVQSKSVGNDSIIDNMETMMANKINYKLILLVQISRIIPIGAALCAVGYIIYLLAKPDNWS